MSSTLQYAIKMENDAEKFYADQAKAHDELGIAAVFRELAKAERRHAEKIEATIGGQNAIDPYEKDEFPTLYSNRQHFASEVRNTVSELEVYSAAMELERESIELYKSLKERAGEGQDPQVKLELALLDWLINEEQRHYRLFDELREMIRLGDEHVEDAEFANPPEY